MNVILATEEALCEATLEGVPYTLVHFNKGYYAFPEGSDMYYDLSIGWINF